MSHSCYTGIAKFVLHGFFEGQDHDLNYDPDNGDMSFTKLLCPDSYYYGELSSDDEEILETLVSFGGWTHVKYDRDNPSVTDIVGLKKDKGVIGDMWVRDNHKIWIVNESPYSSGGDYLMSVASNAKEAIESFLEDHKSQINWNSNSSPIQEDDVIQCWW